MSLTAGWHATKKITEQRKKERKKYKLPKMKKKTEIQKGVHIPIFRQKNTKKEYQKYLQKVKQNHKKINKRKHTENGNNKNIKIMSWNKANSHMLNRINTVRHLIEEHKPDIFPMQETNIRQTDNLEDYQLETYDLLLDKMLEKGVWPDPTYTFQIKSNI